MHVTIIEHILHSYGTCSESMYRVQTAEWLNMRWFSCVFYYSPFLFSIRIPLKHIKQKAWFMFDRKLLVRQICRFRINAKNIKVLLKLKCEFQIPDSNHSTLELSTNLDFYFIVRYLLKNGINIVICFNLATFSMWHVSTQRTVCLHALKDTL